MSIIERLEPVRRLDQDLKKAAIILDRKEAQFLVANYYTWQDNRIRAANQIRSNADSNIPPPNSVLNWSLGQAEILEGQIKLALQHYAKNHPMGEWLFSVEGIGPVIAAGFIAHLDEDPPPTVGHWWAFAGLDPSKKWNKGEKRPWNADLKTLCWKAGESFVKQSGKDSALYGQLYKQKKAQYEAKNNAGGFADRAAQILKEKNFGKTTDAYKWYSGQRSPETAPEWRMVAVHKKTKKLHHRVESTNPDPEFRQQEIKIHLLQMYGQFHPDTWEIKEQPNTRTVSGKGMLPPAHIHAMAKRWAVKIFLAHYHGKAFELRYGEKPPLPYPVAHLGHAHVIEP